MFDFFRPAEPSNTKLGERNESEHSNTVDVSTEVVVSNDDKSIVDKSESITITESRIHQLMMMSMITIDMNL